MLFSYFSHSQKMPNRRSCSADCFGAGRQPLAQSAKNSGHDTISCPKPSSQKQAHHINSRRMTWFSQGLQTDSAVHSAGCVITHISVPNTRRLVLKVTCRNTMTETLIEQYNLPIFPWVFLWSFLHLLLCNAKFRTRSLQLNQKCNTVIFFAKVCNATTSIPMLRDSFL